MATRMPQRKHPLFSFWHAFCLVNNITKFKMRYTKTPFRLRLITSIVLLLTFFCPPEMNAQEWSLEPCCGKRPKRGNTTGAFEVSGGNVALGLNGGTLNRMHADIAWFGASRGPLKRGVRLGLSALGSSITDASPMAESPTAGVDVVEQRYRMVLPELSSVLRLDPFRGGFRPFLEGEFGMAATALDERNFGAAGERSSYRLVGLDPTVHFGWSAGTRIRMGRATFLTLRYGQKMGGSLDLYDVASPGNTAGALEEMRHCATVGFSFGR